MGVVQGGLRGYALVRFFTFARSDSVQKHYNKVWQMQQAHIG